MSAQPNAEAAKQSAQANALAVTAILFAFAIVIPWYAVAFICNLPNAMLSALERRQRRQSSWK